MRPLFLHLTAVMVAMLVSVALAENDVFVPANDVSFSIEREHKSCKIGQPIGLIWKVTNVSRAAIFVPRDTWDVKCPSPPHVLAWLENASGKHFIPGYVGSCMGANGLLLERMKKDAVLLRPGEMH